ncbi:PREDICTED: traB domain-containing protein [Myotis brandtii]|uniref:traB domain-containing protein n=1 Tax=Myotis brandtii TaxID=109478 RepID=UPI00070424DE|nr:PREDICTED: traB domain-containing protein [Myotis brandtii]
MAESRTCCARPGTLEAKTTDQTPSPDRAPCTAWAPGEDGPVSSGSLVGAEPPAAMEEEEEQPAQETNTDPAGTSGAAEMVPRAPPGEPQNLCSCSQDHAVLGGEGGPLLGLWTGPAAQGVGGSPCGQELEAEDGSRVYVVGTAHFSDDSKKDVVKTIRAVQPDVVVVELSPFALSLTECQAEEEELGTLSRLAASLQNGVMSGLMQMLLLKVSAHITEQLGMAPGGEFREAFKEASKVPFCKFHLGDRPIPVTFKRAIAALSFWQKVKLAWGLCFLSDPISKDDVERCKQKDLLEQMMAEMIGEFPDLHRTIVSERDVYLTYMLRQLQAKRSLRLQTGDNGARHDIL